MFWYSYFDQSSNKLYLDEIKSAKRPLVGKSARTWPPWVNLLIFFYMLWINDSMCIVHFVSDEEVQVLDAPPVGQKMSAKLLQFHENYRPAYYGTWRKTSRKLSARNPFAKDDVSSCLVMCGCWSIWMNAFSHCLITKLTVMMNGRKKNQVKASLTQRSVAGFP